jgi:proline iminopeptidase
VVMSSFKPLSTSKQPSFAVQAPKVPGSEKGSRTLYPPIEPFDSGYLAVGDGHELFYEVSGNRNGEPALFLHGGPGGGCGAHTRQFFDPSFYRIVTFDQRGCHRSKPNAATDWEPAIHENNTQALVEDCEKLRKHLGVDVWYTVLGGSWGSTLGLALAQTYTSTIKHLVLRGVFLFTPREIDYLFQSGEAFAHHPEAWEGFRDHIRLSCEEQQSVGAGVASLAAAKNDGENGASQPVVAGTGGKSGGSSGAKVRSRTNSSFDTFDWETERQNLLGAYYRRLCCDDAEVANAAARAFVRYELTISKTFPDPTKLLHVLATPSILIPFALFEAHYMLNNGFLRRGQLLDNAYKMIAAGMPVRIVHGRCDFVCRAESAYHLYKALDPDGTRTQAGEVGLEMVSGAGHSDSEPGLIDALVRATDEFRDRKARNC